MKNKNLLNIIQQKTASIGWKMFIYFNNFTEEEYWNQIYEQEKRHKKNKKNPMSKPTKSPITSATIAILILIYFWL